MNYDDEPQRVIVPMPTPWGVAQTMQQFGDGITFYTTACHGGFHLSEETNNSIPDYLRIGEQRLDSTIGGTDLNKPEVQNENLAPGWYEEDCAAAIVVTCFPARFSDKQRKSAQRTMAEFFPGEYQRFVAERSWWRSIARWFRKQSGSARAEKYKIVVPNKSGDTILGEFESD